MFYKVVCGIARFLLRPRIRFEGRELLPEDGALVLIANHRHAFDPIAVGLAVKRPVAFLAKKELFAKKIPSWFLTKLKCIPIDRDNMDRAALRQSIDVLDDGGILGVFPEGTRSADGKLLPFKSGVSFIASQSECVIVPMAVEGSHRLLNPFAARVRVRVGVPFPYESLDGEKRRQTLERMTQKQEDSVRLLLEEM
jgi:1-acyl-sn-glycerol-3-phosphate acyltransferase